MLINTYRFWNFLLYLILKKGFSHIHTHSPTGCVGFRHMHLSGGCSPYWHPSLPWEMQVLQCYESPRCSLPTLMLTWGRNSCEMTPGASLSATPKVAHVHLWVPAPCPHFHRCLGVSPCTVPGEDAQGGLGRVVMPWGCFWQQQSGCLPCRCSAPAPFKADSLVSKGSLQFTSCSSMGWWCLAL